MSYGIIQDVVLAANVLNDGGVIGMPTETVYGLAARADYEESVGRIFDIKGRPRNHPLIAHIAPETSPERWGQLNDSALKLAKEFWPGPLTILVPRTSEIGLWVTGGRESVAIRMPSHPVTQDLLRQVDDAVVAPSANKFGKVSPTTAQHVLNDLKNEVDCILDGGPSTVGLESTIVECIGNNVTVLRPGSVTALEISRVLHLTTSDTVGESRAPGMMISHYAPDARIVLVSTLNEANDRARTDEEHNLKSMVLNFESAEEYAVRMYDALRAADILNYQTVYAVLPATGGLGDAVRDRLQKAAAPRF